MTLRNLGAATAVAFTSLRVHPMRTGLASLGVVIGVAALVSVLSLGDGLEDSMRDMVRADGRLQSFSIATVTTDNIAGQRVPRLQPPLFSAADRAALQARLAAVGPDVSARLQLTGVSRVNEPWARQAGVQGIPVTATSTVPASAARPLSAGRMFSEDEVTSGAAVAIAAPELARLLGADALGRTIRLGERAVTIVGVLADDVGRPMAVVPITIASDVLARGAEPPAPALFVHADLLEHVPPAIAESERWLASRFGAGWSDSATVRSYRTEIAQGARSILMFKLFMGAITGISLLVGGIGIMNVLLASVSERTREIGIRRAAGASRRDVFGQFLAESLAISVAGSAAGALLGVGMAFVETWFMQRMAMATIAPGLSVATISVAVGAALVIGVSFGAYPALRASRLSPIEAIRHE